MSEGRLIWFDLGNGRQVLRRVRPADLERDSKRADFPSPSVRRDSMPAIRSVADGVEYDSRSAYEKSLRAAGYRIADPAEDLTRFEPPKIDRAAQRDAIRRAINDVEWGAAPPVLTKAPTFGASSPEDSQ